MGLLIYVLYALSIFHNAIPIPTCTVHVHVYMYVVPMVFGTAIPTFHTLHIAMTK